MTMTLAPDAVKETGLMFVPKLARKIINGEKRRTMRPLRNQPHPDFKHFIGVSPCRTLCFSAYPPSKDAGASGIRMKCLWGKAGDLIWVRETHAMSRNGDGVVYKADVLGTCARAEHGGREFCSCGYCGRWQPSLLMKREHARAVLRITTIGAIRVQDVTEEQASTEGLDPYKLVDVHLGIRPRSIRSVVKCSYREAFEWSWDQLYGDGPYGWANNPWVANIEFALIDNVQPRAPR